MTASLEVVPATVAGATAAIAAGAFQVRVAVETPQHAGLGDALDYLSDRPLPPGTLLRVPLGRREVPGLTWPEEPDNGAAPAAAADVTAIAPIPVAGGQAATAPLAGAADLAGAAGLATATSTADATPAPPSLRPIGEALSALPPLGEAWCRLVAFAARYYQRGLGEVALAVLPPELRKLGNAQIAQRIAKLRKSLGAASSTAADDVRTPPAAGVDRSTPPAAPADAGAWPALSDPQAEALSRIASAIGQQPAETLLLHGVTGSGKTEVYLGAAARVLAAGRQVLVMVPEINLTPQLEARFAERFHGRCIVSLHSALTPAQRLRSWLAAHLGLADLVLGTRLAIFASLPRLGLIVVDEEHDPSYKQQDRARYSARDLAVWRGRQEGATVILGSATPSLESWQRVLDGRYRQLDLPARIGGGAMPVVRMVDMNQLPRTRGVTTAVSPALAAALQARIDRGEQSLVFLNRRGYATALHCGDCGWKSGCPNCSAWRVFHKLDRSLRCHHCGFAERVPRACPDCGNLDIAPLGRGTEKLEEQLGQLLTRPGGGPARIARIDADSTRHKGSLQAQLGAVHAGEVDVLVGTQMVTKGHDFRRITLVAAVDPDSSLFSSDFRAPERLFALLMQAAGRAGRDAAQADRSEMWVQTWHPRHALYAALRGHDFHAFAASQLREREMAGLPPCSHLAMLRADARTPEAARAFLQAASGLAASLPGADAVVLYPPVPLAIARVANVERMQMLVEAASRPRLQRFLADWLPALHTLRRQLPAGEGRILRWAVDVDPLSI